MLSYLSFLFIAGFIFSLKQLLPKNGVPNDTGAGHSYVRYPGLGLTASPVCLFVVSPGQQSLLLATSLAELGLNARKAEERETRCRLPLEPLASFSSQTEKERDLCQRCTELQGFPNEGNLLDPGRLLPAFLLQGRRRTEFPHIWWERPSDRPAREELQECPEEVWHALSALPWACELWQGVPEAVPDDGDGPGGKHHCVSPCRVNATAHLELWRQVMGQSGAWWEWPKFWGCSPEYDLDPELCEAQGKAFVVVFWVVSWEIAFLGGAPENREKQITVHMPAVWIQLSWAFSNLSTGLSAAWNC